MEDEDCILVDVGEEAVADSARRGSVQGSADVAIFELVVVAAIDDVQIRKVCVEVSLEWAVECSGRDARDSVCRSAGR